MQLFGHKPKSWTDDDLKMVPHEKLAATQSPTVVFKTLLTINVKLLLVALLEKKPGGHQSL